MTQIASQRWWRFHPRPLPQTCNSSYAPVGDSLIDFSRTVRPLALKLESCLQRTNRTKRVAARIHLDWTAADDEAFAMVKQRLAQSQRLHFATKDAAVCVFTDASEVGWGLVVTQVRGWQVDTPVLEQNHELLVCKSGVFSGSEARWSIIEKEGYPIVWACTNLGYLLIRPQGFKLNCDHKNLIYIFAPHVETKRHIRGKLQRWAMILTGLQLVIERIDGTANVWADLLSRWGSPLVKEIAVKYVQCRYLTRRTRQKEQRLRLKADGFEYPTLTEIAQSQQRHTKQAPSGAQEQGGLLYVCDKIWIPANDRQLVQRIMIVAHCGAQGHKGLDAMITSIGGIFTLGDLRQQCSRFLAKCLMCKHGKGGNFIPRPWGPTYTATRRDQLVHWDYLYMGDSWSSPKYVLVIKDGLSHFCELVAGDAPTSSTAAEALLDWHKRIALKFWFRTVDFVIAYSPWINGTVERFNRAILQVARVMLLEFSLDTRKWDYMLPLVQGNLNHTPVASLGNHTPSEVFTGLPRSDPLTAMVTGNLVHDGKALMEKDEVVRQLNGLRDSLHKVHRQVQDQKEMIRNRQIARHQGQEVNFVVGDFVLWSRIDERLSTNKLLARWAGPFVVVEALPHAFRVQHLVTKKEHVVHSSRLKFYCDSSLDVTEEMLVHVANQGMLLEVDSILAHRHDRGQWWLLVSWVGLQRDEASWELLRDMFRDVPRKVQDYVRNANDPELSIAHQDL